MEISEKDTAAESAKKSAILAVSFGTSYREQGETAIGGVERALEAAYPDFEVRRAYTSGMIIRKLKERDNVAVDSVEEALIRLEADGFEHLVVQPTHVMNGYEYDEMMETVRARAGRFQSVRYGRPLLGSEADYGRLIGVLAVETAGHDRERDAVVLMGHGTGHGANETYARLAARLREAGYSNYYVGTVEADPGLEDVAAQVKAGDYGRVLLLPLMIVAGDHANNDMAGPDGDSWKGVFEAAGYEVECVLRGMGEYPGVQRMFVDHVRDALRGGA